MAESCNVNMEARSPQSTFSTFASKAQSSNYKKIFITAFNEEENLQEQPKAPHITKPLPPLEPLFEIVPHAFVPVHPKKRLKREQDDPMLADAAASPGSCSSAEIRAQFENGHMLSNPNSPFPSLSSPLDTSGLSDSAYFSGLSPLSVFSSPGSVTQASSPVDMFPSTASSLVTKTSLENNSHVPPADKGKQEPASQKPCPRPQSVALDLTSVPKQRFIPRYAPHPSHPPPQQHLVAAPAHPSIPQLLLNEGHQFSEIRKVFPSSCLSPTRTIPHNSHPQVPQQCFEGPPGLISPTVPPKILYNQTNHQVLPGSVGTRMHAPHEGGGVIKPKATHLCKRPFPNPYLQPLSHRRKLPPLHLPGSQRNRMPSEMIYSNQGFPRDMPNVALQLPTASAKKVPWLHDEDSIGPHPTNPTRNDIDNDLGYKDKLIEEWNHQDVIYYMFDSAKELNFAGQHLNFYELNAVTGKDLCQMTRDDFKRFAPKAADHLFQNFRARLLQEKRQQQQVAAHATSSHQDINKNRIVPEATSPFDFINQSKSFFSPANHNLSHHHPAVQPQQPAVIFRDSPVGCDASARYEIRYETVDGRAIGLDDGNNKRLILGSLPSASRKSFDLLHAPSPAAPFEVDENISDPDQSSNEEEVVKPEPPKKRGPGRPRKPENELKKKRKKTGRLWEFIRNLLLDPETCPSLVRWDDPEQGVFRFVQADKVAQRWGQRKQNRDMNYEKLSRAMRYYYKGGVFEPVIGRRLVYKFGKNAKGWRPSNPNFTNQCPSLPPPPPPPPHSSSH